MSGQDGFKALMREMLLKSRKLEWVTFFDGENSREEEEEGIYIYNQALIGGGS